jgi:hypothetical protein
MWIAISGAQFLGKRGISETEWGGKLVLTSLTASMIVNALVTGLIVFRIFRVFRHLHEVKSVNTSGETSLRITGGKKLRSIIFIIIESGMALFKGALGLESRTGSRLVSPAIGPEKKKITLP